VCSHFALAENTGKKGRKILRGNGNCAKAKWEFVNFI
jgi:hypothetical protein